MQVRLPEQQWRYLLCRQAKKSTPPYRKSPGFLGDTSVYSTLARSHKQIMNTLANSFLERFTAR
jgi:hypothetical protein